MDMTDDVLSPIVMGEYEDFWAFFVIGTSVAEPYQLTARFKAGTSILEHANIEPAISGFDMPTLVKYVEEVSGGLPLLLTLVRGAATGLLSAWIIIALS
jgi:hypothetical protein